MKLTSHVRQDEITTKLAKAFDYSFDGTTTTEVKELPSLPEAFSIGLIVGPSGSGKSTLLRSIGLVEQIEWRSGQSVASHFADADDAIKRLAAVGLNSIPAWCRPFDVLSTGEMFRAEMARRLKDGACIDEFTSVVDRNVARSCSAAIHRYIKEAGLQKIVFATCHYDVIPWLDPDWVYDTATGVLTPRGSRSQRPTIDVDLLPCSAEVWPLFRPHHYLSEKINHSARCWLAVWRDSPIGFASAIAFPNGYIKRAWREHRTVVLPDFQGLGIGVRISDAVAEMFITQGCRYFSKTAHPRMGQYRDASPLWKPTSKNKRDRKDYNHTRKTKEDAYRHLHADRLAWSHEYVGFPA